MVSSVDRAGTWWRVLRKIGWLAAVAIGACAIVVPPAHAQPQTVKIAAQLSVSGVRGILGGPALEGAQLAVEEANASGQTPKIELAVYDDATDPDRGRELAGQIVASDALVVVGPASTVMALASGPIYAQAGLVALGTTVTGDNVTLNATFYRSAFSTSDGGEAFAAYLRYVLGNMRAAVIFKDDGYGRQFAAGFTNAALGLGIATRQYAYKDVPEAEQAAREAAADPARPAFILGSDTATEGVPVLLTLRRLGVKAPILAGVTFAADSFADYFADLPEERQKRGAITDGLYAETAMLFDSANAETIAFVERFRARFGKAPVYATAQGYEAARVAIAAARSAAATTGAGASAGASASAVVQARRDAVHDFMYKLNGPANAVPGLNGPIWFTPDGGREQALRIGRFQDGVLLSAPSQLVPVRNPDPAETASGAVVDVGYGHYARRQQVVYAGVYLNEITRMDIAQSRFTGDFYLWMRFARGPGAGPGAADPTQIDFPDLIRGTSDGKLLAAQRDLPDGTTYRLWRLRGDFKNDYDLHHYPDDRQTLAIRFFNANAATDRIVYAADQRSYGAGSGVLPEGTGAAPSDGIVHAAQAAPGVANEALNSAFAPDAFRNLTQWEALRVLERRDSLVTKSALGDPGLVGLERVRELSGFNVTVDVRRRVVATLAKTLLPLGLMALIMYASLYFPVALVKEKITVAITGALSGAVLLVAINNQLGNIGYVIAVEYGFYAYFTLCLLCIVAVLLAERLRMAGRQQTAVAVERSGRYVFLLGLVGTVAAGVVCYLQW